MKEGRLPSSFFASRWASLTNESSSLLQIRFRPSSSLLAHYPFFSSQVIFTPPLSLSIYIYVDFSFFNWKIEKEEMIDDMEMDKLLFACFALMPTPIVSNGRWDHGWHNHSTALIMRPEIDHKKYVCPFLLPIHIWWSHLRVQSWH